MIAGAIFFTPLLYFLGGLLFLASILAGKALQKILPSPGKRKS